jgi:hypothetical protein
MAALTAANMVPVFRNGLSDQVVLYAVRDVTTGDTYTMPEFSIAKQAVILGTTVAGTESCAISGNTVTIPSGLSGDAGYMLVWGASS